MIPLLDLRAQYAGIKAELDAAVLEALASGAYVSGPKVDAFEKSFAAYTGAKEAVALNSGTSALHLALLALGIGPGDEVIAPAMTFVATVAAVRYAGATPVLVDADPLTWNIDPRASRARSRRAPRPLSPSTCAAAWPTWTPSWRSPRSMACRSSRTPPRRMARPGRAGAQARLARSAASASTRQEPWRLRRGGGASPTIRPRRSDAQAARLGQEGRYNHVEHAFNYRMDGIQGAILSVKLAHLPRWTERRRASRSLLRYAARRASRAAASEAQGVGTRLPRLCAAPSGPRPACARPRRSRRRDGLHYPRPVHLQPAYAVSAAAPAAFRWPRPSPPNSSPCPSSPSSPRAAAPSPARCATSSLPR